MRRICMDVKGYLHGRIVEGGGYWAGVGYFTNRRSGRSRP
jgi:hypothetical protein